MLFDQIKNDLVLAMREKNEIRRDTLRGLLTGFTNELVAKGKKPDETPDDELAISIVKRQRNQRKDSIEQFINGGRNDLADVEKKELTVLEEYLPKELSADAIRKIAQDIQNNLGITDHKQIGQLMGAVMKEIGNKADGAVVKKIVEGLLK